MKLIFSMFDPGHSDGCGQAYQGDTKKDLNIKSAKTELSYDVPKPVKIKSPVSALSEKQGLMQAVFDIGIPILGTIIRACPNLFLSKTETTINRSSSFLIKSATQYDDNN